jgi:uncharacterized damage-inducible protein DinB
MEASVMVARLLFLSFSTSMLALGPTNAQADPPDLKGTGFRAELIKTLGFYEKKVIGLLEAFPQDKLSWRPADGVKTASEVFMHMAQSPRAIGGFLKGEKPDFKKLMAREKEVTDKAALIEEVKNGFAAAKAIVGEFSKAQLEETITAPWKSVHSKRFFLEIFARHAAEHLGQLTTYARVNGIVPPWRVPKRPDAPPAKEGKKE